jgi:outer membrane biosynthesis protein TonB
MGGRATCVWSALEKVKTWLFEPGKRNGQPVSVAMTLEVDFRLF